MILKTLYTPRSTLLTLSASLFLAVLTVTLFAITKLNSVEIFFLIFLLSVYTWNINSKVSFTASLLNCLAIPLLLSIKKTDLLNISEGLAEAIGVWVFYFLCIGVLKQISEVYQEEKIDKIITGKEITVPTYKLKPTIQKGKVPSVKKAKVIHDIKPLQRK